MIARITGRLEQIADATALVDIGAGMWYEVHTRLRCRAAQSALGQDVVLHTLHYVEGDPSHGQLTPRLVGFLSEADREFFRVFTTVKGIGIRKALRALARPVAEIAAAIQAKDAKFLTALPEIGRRTAEQVVAELHGKVEKFAGALPAEEKARLPEPAQEAVAVLVQLGERRADAMALIERVLAVAPELASPELILQQAYRLKAGGL